MPSQLDIWTYPTKIIGYLTDLSQSQHTGTLNLIHHDSLAVRDLLKHLYSHPIAQIMGSNWPVGRLIALHDLAYDYNLRSLLSEILGYLREMLNTFFVVGMEFKPNSFGWIWELAAMLWTMEKDEQDAVRRYGGLRAEVVIVIRERMGEAVEEEVKDGLSWLPRLKAALS
jgi:hypothetical protein